MLVLQKTTPHSGEGKAIGFFRKLSGADAAKDAARIQAAAGNEAIDQLRAELGIARQDLQPFVDVGGPALDDLRGFNTFESQEAYASNDPAFQNVRDFTARPIDFDPTARLNPVLNFDPTANNPIYDAAAGEAMRRVEESRAARGKFDSGGTLVDLTNATAMTRNDLANSELSRLLQTAGIGIDADLAAVGVDQQENQTDFNRLIQEAGLKSGLTTDQFNRLLSVANLSQASAAGQASNQQALGSQVAGITQSVGNARAAGIVGAANANRSFLMDIAKLRASV